MLLASNEVVKINRICLVGEIRTECSRCEGEEHMVLVSVMYPSEPESSFNLDYYLQTHIPLVRERWKPMGLEDMRLLRGVGTPDGTPPPLQVISLLSAPCRTFKAR